jgi:hypothetical protein
MNTIRPRRITIEASMLAIALAITLGMALGVEFAGGILSGAALVLLGFGLAAHRIEQQAARVAQGGAPTAGPSWIWSLRLLLMAGAGWLLLGRFPPLSVVLGFSLLVVVILCEAVVAAARSRSSTTMEA